MSVEDMARVLHGLTDGLEGEGTATWPDPQHREVYALAIEEVAQAILADPAPLLAALAEAGVLEVEWNVAGVDNEGCEWTAGLQEDEPPPLLAWMKRDNGHHEHRYVSDWTEVQS